MKMENNSNISFLRPVFIYQIVQIFKLKMETNYISCLAILGFDFDTCSPLVVNYFCDNIANVMKSVVFAQKHILFWKGLLVSQLCYLFTIE
jgi:hypothetical protein